MDEKSTDGDSDVNLDKSLNQNQNGSLEKDSSQLWDQIGFHKPMAGFWFNIVYTLIGIIISATLMGYLMNFFYPFPESWGYKEVTFSMFSLMFVVFDLGTGAVMSRFIPEANIVNPEKMLHYIQYFIWYQMITGLIQTTAVSIYALYFATQSNLSYTVWIMLICSTTQYPGFLGVFRNVLDSLQQYNKTQTITFLTGTIIQRITEMGFVYLGRLYGEANPQIGPILGIAIGAAIGLYVDDFLAMLLSAYFFSIVMKEYGIKAKMCFQVQFSWAEIKPMLIYSIKIGTPGILNSALSLVELLFWVKYIPQYTTIKILASVGGSIGDVISWFGTPNITALVSEAYLNDKKRLTQYYIGQIIRFNSFILGFFIPLILVVNLVIFDAWIEFNMLNYLGAILFIIPRLINISFNRFFSTPGEVMNGANRPNFGVIMGIIQRILTTILYFFYLAVWQIHKLKGLVALAWIMECGILPLNLLFALISYVYVYKKIIKIKIPWGQILFGFILSSGITYFLQYVAYRLIYIPLYASYGFFVAMIPSIIVMALILLFVFAPLTGFFGGWDDINLEEFRKVSQMSGPSKIVVIPIYKILKWACNRSYFHNRFQLSNTGILEEAQDLLILKRTNRKELKKLLNG